MSEKTNMMNRRSMLKHTSAAGVGLAGIIGERSRAAESSGRIRFSEVGVTHEIVTSDPAVADIELDAPPKYDLGEDEVIFYTDYLFEDEIANLGGSKNIVAGEKIQNVPFENISLTGGNFHLPTATRADLVPRSGVLLESSESLPTVSVLEAGPNVVLRTGGDTYRIGPNDGKKVSLGTFSVDAKSYETRGTGAQYEEGGEGGTIHESVKTVSQIEVRPKVTVRNHGELNANKAANRRNL